MGHTHQPAPPADLDATTARTVASTLQALAAPSRLLILSRLRQSPCPVGSLANDIGLEQSAVSHQLRLLRTLGLVTSERVGRHTVYSLYDNHVSALIDEAVYHAEHLRMGAPDPPQHVDPLEAR